MRLAWIPFRAVLLVFAASWVFAVAAPGCLGRSDLEDPDLQLSGGSAGLDAAGGVGGSGGSGGAPGGTGGSSTGGAGGSGGLAGSGGTGGASACGPTNCQGCCDAVESCRSGTAINACGLGGVRCLDCSALGFSCTEGACEGPPPTCGPQTCPGCCDAMRCRFGTELDACGSGGDACVNCAAVNQGCSGGVCQGVAPSCGPQNCGGCCDAQGVCRSGDTQSACGSAGAACQNCAANGSQCFGPTNYCAFLPTCGSTTCPTGCCDAAAICRDGRTNAACGSTGQQCVDCGQSGQQCAPQGFCYTGQHCGPDNCAGCCAATGECQAGTSSLSCGQFGGLCDNCEAKAQTCQNRVCSSGSTCPAPYSGCNPGALTTPPAASSSCTAAQLSQLASACAGQNPGAACAQYFNSLLSSNPRCYDCMLQFIGGDDGYARCVAPFLTPSCNHDVTCAVECGNTSCGGCSSSQEQTCRDSVFNTGGACRSWINGYFCLQAAIQGPGSFCDFQLYNDVGRWLQAVGQHYCGG